MGTTTNVTRGAPLSSTFRRAEVTLKRNWSSVLSPLPISHTKLLASTRWQKKAKLPT